MLLLLWYVRAMSAALDREGEEAVVIAGRLPAIVNGTGPELWLIGKTYMFLYVSSTTALLPSVPSSHTLLSYHLISSPHLSYPSLSPSLLHLLHSLSSLLFYMSYLFSSLLSYRC